MGNIWTQTLVGASALSTTVLGPQLQNTPWLVIGCFLVWILSIMYLIACNVTLFNRYLVPSLVFDILAYTTVLLSLGLPPAESCTMLPGIITLGIVFVHVVHNAIHCIDAWLSRRYQVPRMEEHGLRELSTVV